MPPLRPFRFAAPAIRAASGAALAAQARRVEDLGYATLVIPDHFLPTNMAAGPALMAAAAATTTLRVGTTVYDNDFRHPALLAKEAATLHVLTDGRFEFGIGAGYYKAEYDQTGIPFSPAGVRVGRLEEAVALIKALWGPDPVTFAGRYYRVSNLRVMAPPHPPYPPLYIGAGGKRLLSFAAREANIIGIIAPSQSGGGLALAQDSEATLALRVEWVRQAAGERFADLELALLTWWVAVTEDRQQAAERIATNTYPVFHLTAAQVLQSPYFLIGSVEALVDRLQELRARHGISYISLFPATTAREIEAFAPVVARLAGT